MPKHKRNPTSQHGTRVCPESSCGKTVPSNKSNGALQRHKDRYGNKCRAGERTL